MDTLYVAKKSGSDITSSNIMEQYTFDFKNEKPLWLDSLKQGNFVGILSVDVSPKNELLSQPDAKVLMLAVLFFNLIISSKS